MAGAIWGIGHAVRAPRHHGCAPYSQHGVSCCRLFALSWHSCSLKMARLLPISELSPFACRWAILARVTSKSDLRIFNRVASKGRVLSVDLLD